MPESLLIEHGTIASPHAQPTILGNHSILVEDGLIKKIGPDSSITPYSGKRIDARGKLVMPGFINAHTHFYSTFARGYAKSKPSDNFVDVLKNLWWRLDSALTPEDCYCSAMLSILESIRHGTTTIIDHHASPNAVTGSLAAIERAVLETGIRACLCYEVSDRDGARIAREGLEENASFIRHCQQQRSPFLKSLFGLHASFTLTDLTVQAASQLGHDLETGFHIHIAEAKSDQDYAADYFGMSVVQRLKKFGILGAQTIAAHCVHVNHEEMDILADTKTMVVHNPQSNLNNAVGTADLIEMNARGILLGLGTDAMTTNMLEELRVALWAQHAKHRHPSVGFQAVTSALFENNPIIAERIFGFPFGCLREGSAADIILIDYDPITPLENENLYGHLLFGASQAIVDTTIAGGRILLQNRKLQLDIDENQINAHARELAGKLWTRIG